MQVKMLKVSASALLCADAGEIVTVDDILGKQLIAAGAAKAHLPVRRETAMIDPKSIEEAERERSRALAEAEAARKKPDVIKQALDQLDAEEDEDWTAAGKPAMDRIKELTGSATLTRAEVDAAFPDFSRPLNDAPTAPPPAQPVPATKAGPRSSAP
ncbi:hypothetical protein GLP52_03635 [Sulfitobacter sp. M22]|nr:hypothetical protein [Sulfitobacter sp. M22]